MTKNIQTSQTPVPLGEELLKQCEGMALHIASSGSSLPGNVMVVLQAARKTLDLQALATAHAQLSRLVAPATPQGISVIYEASHSLLAILGPVPIIRRMSVVALLSMATFIATSLQENVNGDANVYNQFGLSLFLNEIFLISAAAMGACFVSLFNTARTIAERRYDANAEHAYLIKLLLGLMAGFILAMLIPVSDSTSAKFSRPVLAMLGGFSATAVHSVLSQLVHALESLVHGDLQATIATQQRAANTRAAEEKLQQQTKLASSLVQFQQQLVAGGDKDQLQRQLSAMLNEVVPGSTIATAVAEKPATQVLADGLANMPDAAPSDLSPEAKPSNPGSTVEKASNSSPSPSGQ